MFPPKVRLTSAAVGYDLAQSTASAFTPLIATVLLQNYGSKAPGLIYPFFAVSFLPLDFMHSIMCEAMSYHVSIAFFTE